MKKIHDIQAPGRTPGAPAPRRQLDDLLAWKNTVLCIVFGEGGDADAVSATALSLANNTTGCDSVEVVRIRDPRLLAPAEGTWRPDPAVLVTLLTFERAVSATLPAAKARLAGTLMDRLIAAAAGTIS
jgi:hypothetical protein